MRACIYSEAQFAQLRDLRSLCSSWSCTPYHTYPSGRPDAEATVRSFRKPPSRTHVDSSCRACILQHALLARNQTFAPRGSSQRGCGLPKDAAHLHEDPDSKSQGIQDLAATRKMVETAMLAAVGGFAFAVASILKLTSYLAYFMPLPVVLSAMRNGPKAGQMTTIVTGILLLVLLGPVQCLSYLLNYGLVATAMGSLWHMRMPWVLTVAVCTFVRIAGQAGMLIVSSWAMNENLFVLILHNLHSLLDQCSAALGTSGAPEPAVIAVVAAFMLAFNSLIYLCFMHLIYTILLRNLGYMTPRLPVFTERRIAAS